MERLMKYIVFATALFSSTISFAFASESEHGWGVRSVDAKLAIQCAALYMEASFSSGHHDPRSPGFDALDKKGSNSLDMAYHFSNGNNTVVDTALVIYFEYLSSLSSTDRGAELKPMWSTCETMLNKYSL